MIIGKKFCGSKIIDITSQRYIGFTQDNLGVWSVFELDVVLDKPINRLEGMTCNVKLYEIFSPLHTSRLSDVKPRIHHK